MTQRDIAKDKEKLEEIQKRYKIPSGSVHGMAVYWIAQYEIAQSKLDVLGSGNYVVMLADTYNKDVDDFKALQARISDLETQLHSYNLLDAAKLPEHDIALKKILGELEGGGA